MFDEFRLSVEGDFDLKLLGNLKDDDTYLCSKLDAKIRSCRIDPKKIMIILKGTTYIREVSF